MITNTPYNQNQSKEGGTEVSSSDSCKTRVEQATCRALAESAGIHIFTSLIVIVIGGTYNTKTATVVRVEVGRKGTTNNGSSLPRGTASRCSTATVIDVRE